MARNCIGCNTPIPDGRTSCPMCSAPIEQALPGITIADNLEQTKNESNPTKSKKCNYCAMAIPTDARICPYCRKKQGMTAPVAIFIIFCFFIAASLVIGAIKTDSRKEATNQEANTPTGRANYAKFIETEFLDKGMDARVVTEGAQGKTLQITYVLMSSAVVHKYLNDTMFLANLGIYNFDKVIFTDGHSSSWPIDLTK
jgi:RNA polymerase subunit RPABC4/transcription elongation factor Spt4